MARHTEHLSSGVGLSAGGRSSTYQRKYTIFEAYSEAEAWTELNSAISGLQTIILDNEVLVLASKRVTPISGEDVGGMWEGVVDWRSAEHPRSQNKAPIIGDNEYELDIGGSTVNLKWAEQGKTTKYPGTAKDLLGAINYEGEEDPPKGVEVITPNLGYTETHFIDVSTVDDTWVRLARDTIGKTNDDTFRGFDANEVLMVAIRGSRRQQDAMWRMTFSMQIGENRTNIPVGETPIIVTSKKAWEYLWILDKKEDGGGFARPIPEAAYVHELYGEADFGAIVPART